MTNVSQAHSAVRLMQLESPHVIHPTPCISPQIVLQLVRHALQAHVHLDHAVQRAMFVQPAYLELKRGQRLPPAASRVVVAHTAGRERLANFVPEALNPTP